jgi:hypothetical protein
LAISEDKIALAVMTIDEHAHRLGRDVGGTAFAFMFGRRVGCQMARHPGTVVHGMLVRAPGISHRLGLAIP